MRSPALHQSPCLSSCQRPAQLAISLQLYGTTLISGPTQSCFSLLQNTCVCSHLLPARTHCACLPQASIPATGDASDPGKVVGKEGMRVSMLRKLTITELAPHVSHRP